MVDLTLKVVQLLKVELLKVVLFLKVKLHGFRGQGDLDNYQGYLQTLS